MKDHTQTNLAYNQVNVNFGNCAFYNILLPKSKKEETHLLL